MMRRRIPYSAEELAWLEANYRMVISDYHAAFVARFGRVDVSVVNLNQLRKRKGWKVGRDGGRYLGRLRLFSPEEIAWLSNHRALPIGEYCQAFQDRFGRSDITAQKLHALRKRQGWKTGRTGQFAKGQEPLNKGKKCEPGKGGLHPNARRTQFKKGQTPHNTNYLGHERIDATDGYVYISVDEPNPHTGYERSYVLKHRWLWEQAGGKLPDGYCLKCLSDDKTNCDPANWEAIPRALLPRLAGGNRYHRKLAFADASPEVRPALLTIAKIEHRAKQLRRGGPAGRSKEGASNGG